ncbi:NAD(P)/FAD-dependent oxidoreductase [Bradyrhizobium acaciae]|uniref:NAD(P)/FAD-dependent oxidoreductase n=1 Tax=Bradyrhizobium acaciae TaxID=2683706 RepID=UPI001E3062EB|nr:FAD-dependent oxidoreductase [Bradyrhizobium acaciae]MCC8984860.1 FAD-binding oxidoreductase [Bradyrhizobium acaciae]
MAGGIDALVVGAGVVGVTAALALQERGLQVMLLEQNSVAEGCSFGNAGLIAPGAFPLSAQYRLTDLPAAFLKSNSPAALDWISTLRLLPWGFLYAKATRWDKVRRDTDLLHDLCRDALRSYEVLLGSDLPQISRRGYLTIHLSSAELEKAIHVNSIRTSMGLTVRMLVGSEIAEFEPALKGVAAAGATLVDGAAHIIDPAAFVKCLANVFVRRGGSVSRDRVQALRSKKSGEVTVYGDLETYSPRTAVLTTGAHANQLLADCDHRIPLVAERGYHLELDVEPGFIGGPLAIPGLGVVLAPSARGARITGISHFGSPGLRARPELLLSALKRARKVLPSLRVRPGFEVWSGERPATPDSLPIIEQIPGYRSMFVSCGHGHLGVTLAAISARILANLVRGNSSNYAAQLSSQRFASN